MNGRTRMAGKAILALASALAFAGAAGAVESADTPPGAIDTAPMELEEIRVHGESLARRIERAEDDFFALYNALNADDRFDVHCGQMALHPGSMIMQRTCVPGFLADQLEPQTVKPAFSLLYSPDGCTRVPSAPPDSTLPAYADGCGFSGPSFLTMDRYLRTTHAGSPAPVSLRAVHYRDRYANTVAAVIRADTRLQDKAAGLSRLYEELQSTQQQYQQMKAGQPATWSLDRRLGAPGPRGR